ncbi:MAG: hypothetical protein JNM68_08280 [Dinghuibacter sp.]|nr:hypothetical protein [Dinghuibacter sp.]
MKLLKKFSIGVALFFLTGIMHISVAQTPKQVEEMREKLEKSTRSLDSATKQSVQNMQRRLDSLNRESIARMNERSYSWIADYQKKKKQEERRKMIMYFSFGAAMLAVLVFGLSRKKKKVV